MNSVAREVMNLSVSGDSPVVRMAETMSESDSQWYSCHEWQCEHARFRGIYSSLVATNHCGGRFETCPVCYCPTRGGSQTRPYTTSCHDFGKSDNLELVSCCPSVSSPEPPIRIFSHDGQIVACSYIRDAGYRIDPSNRQREKSRLIRNLLRSVGTTQESVFEASAATTEIRINSGGLGKPELYVDGREGPSVSFSHTATATWGALCRTGGIVGMDVASGDEFPHNYPFHRAFHDEEFSKALKKTDGNISEAAALLWTAKEAVVKCTGTAFHMIDPLELRVAATARSSGKCNFTVCFDDRVFERLPELRRISMVILTFMEEGARVSVAIMAKNGAENSYDGRFCGDRGLRNFVTMPATGRR